MEVKLFTLEGLKVTILHDLIVVGLLFCWVFINVEFLGRDVTLFEQRSVISKNK